MEEIRAVPRPRVPKNRARKSRPDARERLLEAARVLINEQGMARLRVEDVARHAQLSVGTFYIYFEGKDDLFAQLVVDYTGRLRERMQAVYQGSGELADRMVRGLDAYLDFVEENAKSFLHYTEAGAIQTNVGRLSTWTMSQHAEDLRPLLEEGIAAGIFRDEDPELMAQSVLGFTQHIAGWWLEHREHCSREQLQRFASELIGRGLMK